MIILNITGPIILMAMLTIFSALPLAYGLLAVKTIWERQSAGDSPARALIITAVAALLWIASVIIIAYLLLSPGWVNVLRL